MIQLYITQCLSLTRNVPHTAEAYAAPLTDAMDGMQLKENGSRGATFGSGSADACARCGKTVYLAERKQAAGHVRVFK